LRFSTKVGQKSGRPYIGRLREGVENLEGPISETFTYLRYSRFFFNKKFN
jgi:hypothetical protein